ncbi:MAG: universal stress protein [Gaiellaceae bacterium]
MKTILVGYDGTGPAERALTRAAERALTRAAELAQAFGSKVVVVSVSAPEPVATDGGAFGLMPYYYPATDVPRGPTRRCGNSIASVCRHSSRIAASRSSSPASAASLRRRSSRSQTNTAST